MILDEIVEAKRVRLPEHKKRIDEITMRRLAEETKTRNADCFYRNLKKPGISIIGEFKKASPSLGNITSKMNLMDRIEEYNASVDAISCLTEEDYFHGNASYLKQIRSKSDLPILRKDFMIEEYQFYEAKAIGADAVLLITAILDDVQMHDFYQLARELELGVLVETHDEEDIERQKLNVMRMEMLGAKVVSVESGSNTLKDATNEAIRTWAKTAEDTFYVIGSAVGPYPYPKMVKEFQSVISREAKRQHMEVEGRNPDVVMACVGGGSNSIGMFADFIDEKDVELIGVEAAGLGIETGKHASAMALGEPGVLHGMKSYLLQDTDGNIQLAHSISAGLDYPGVGPEHAYLRDSGRAQYVAITDVEAMDALMELCKLEGIIPAIESAHAVAYAFKKAKEMTMEQSMIVCLSGRGDKDVNTIESYLAGEGYLN